MLWRQAAKPVGLGRGQARNERGAMTPKVYVSLAAVLALAMSLTGCSSPLSSAPLCRGSSTVNRLVVHRIDELNTTRPHAAFGPVIEVTQAARAQEAAKAICALPEQGKYAAAGPPDLGIRYRLRFSAAKKTFPPVTIDSSGSETVEGVGPDRTASRSPRFWSTLGDTIGNRHATVRTFR